MCLDTTLKPMGYDVKLELKYKPATFEVVEHRFPKHGCDKCKSAPVRKPPLPAFIPQSYVSPELLAQIAVAKFCEHSPLYRQEQIYRRSDVHLTRQVMADWMIKLGEGLKPLIGLIHERILDGPVVNADETPVRVLTKDGSRIYVADFALGVEAARRLRVRHVAQKRGRSEAARHLCRLRAD